MKKETEIDNLRFKFIGFKLISLKLEDSKLFGNITYNFVDAEDSQDKLYTTVLIGPNGTKKSLLFNLIIFIFRSIHDLLNDKEIKYEENSKYNSGSYHLTYALNQEIFEFSRHVVEDKQGAKFGYSYKISGEDVEDFKKSFLLPKNIIANSTSFRDKFPFYSQGEFPDYHYLGVKNTPQTASTQAYLKKVIEYVADLSENTNFLTGLDLIAKEFVGEGKSFKISYRTVQHGRFYSKETKSETIDAYFKDMQKRFDESGKRPPNKLQNYNTLSNKNNFSLEELSEFCRTIDDNLVLVKNKGQSNKTLTFSLSKQEDLNNLKINIGNIKKLYSIGLLTDVKLEIEDLKGGAYNIDDSSSGEHNLITSFIGYLATLTQNSLLFIDEPEISLHPNWQMKFVSFLKKLYDHESYKYSHVVIASHSHFIVSDLEGSSSKVIGLTKSNGKIEIMPIGPHIDTFGWSAEEVLYTIFNTRSDRNSFFEFDLTYLITMLNRNSTDVAEITRIYRKFDSLKLSSNDPLLIILEKTKKYLSKLNA